MKNNSLKKNRFDSLDVFRGFAILLMFIFHFSYDLDYFGFIQQNFNHDVFWTRFRLIIVTLFLLIVGISLYLATYRGINKKSYRQRMLLLISYSALVSLSSWMMHPDSMIFFGILHFITVASVFGLLFIRLGVLNLVLGLAIIIVSQTIAHTFFNQPLVQWIGLMTHLPITVDYVPMLPWFGIILIGIYLGEIISRLPAESFIKRWNHHHPATKLLGLGGRYSLHIYMLHQPLFLGILYIINQLIKL